MSKGRTPGWVVAASMSCAPIRAMSPSPYTPAGQVAADHEGQATEDRPLTDPGDIRRQARTRSASSSSNAMPWIVEPGHASRRARAAGRAQGRGQLRRCHHRRGSREKSLDAARTESNARTCHRTWSLTAQRTLTEPPICVNGGWLSVMTTATQIWDSVSPIRGLVRDRVHGMGGDTARSAPVTAAAFSYPRGVAHVSGAMPRRSVMYDDSSASRAEVCVRPRLAIEESESAMTTPLTISEGASLPRGQVGVVPPGPLDPELRPGYSFGALTAAAVEQFQRNSLHARRRHSLASCSGCARGQQYTAAAGGRIAWTDGRKLQTALNEGRDDFVPGSDLMLAVYDIYGEQAFPARVADEVVPLLLTRGRRAAWESYIAQARLQPAASKDDSVSQNPEPEGLALSYPRA